MVFRFASFDMVAKGFLLLILKSALVGSYKGSCHLYNTYGIKS